MATHMKIYFFPSLGCYYEAACAPQKCWKTDVCYRVSTGRVPTRNMSALCWVCKCSRAVTFAWIWERSRMSFCFAGGFRSDPGMWRRPHTWWHHLSLYYSLELRWWPRQSSLVMAFSFVNEVWTTKKMQLALTNGDYLLTHSMKMNWMQFIDQFKRFKKRKQILVSPFLQSKLKCLCYLIFKILQSYLNCTTPIKGKR